jgi:hypothetical protein
MDAESILASLSAGAVHGPYLVIIGILIRAILGLVATVKELSADILKLVQLQRTTVEIVKEVKNGSA